MDTDDQQTTIRWYSDGRAAPPGGVPVLEAVGDQLSFGQVIEPSQLPAAVPAGVKRREALVASLELRRETTR